MFTVTPIVIDEETTIYVFKLINRYNEEYKTYYIFSCRYLCSDSPYGIEFDSPNILDKEIEHIRIYFGKNDILYIETRDIKYDEGMTEMQMLSDVEQSKKSFQECLAILNPSEPI